MKHSVQITLLLLGLFFSAQVIGLLALQQKIDPATGEMSTREEIGSFVLESPEEIQKPYGFLYILAAILLGTMLILFIIKFRKPMIWKVWFYLAVVICLTLGLKQFINPLLAFALALIFGTIKIFKPNVYVHNLTELFIYAGLAVIFVPVLTWQAALILLILISIYDMYAVWKSKHMVALAEFQTTTKVFAGMMIPYQRLAPKGKGKKRKIKTAVLGGGDIGFPLIFAGTIMKHVGIGYALIIPVFVTIALTFLLFKGKKDTFYPAMPFITVGCLLGHAAVWLLTSM